MGFQFKAGQIRINLKLSRVNWMFKKCTAQAIADNKLDYSARFLARVGIIKESGVLMSIFTSNEQWGYKGDQTLPDSGYPLFMDQQLERNDTVLRRFPSKKSPNLCSPDSYPYRMGNFSVK